MTSRIDEVDFLFYFKAVKFEYRFFNMKQLKFEMCFM